MESNEPFILSEDYDVLITDITDVHFVNVASLLNTPPRLTHSGIDPENQRQTKHSIEGVIFGNCHRVFFPLDVSSKKESINVIFLYDSGSPHTFLRRDTFDSLGFRETTPSNARVRVHGHVIDATLSHGHFENVDILGHDFMERVRGRVTLDFANKTGVLEF